MFNSEVSGSVLDPRQEIDGPQAEQLKFFPCRQILQDEEEEKLSPAQKRAKRDPLFYNLLVKVKETFLTTQAQNGSWRPKREKHYSVVALSPLPVNLFARIHLAGYAPIQG